MQYRLDTSKDAKLGEGSFGKVYKAWDTKNNNRAVAIKVITKNGISEEQLIQMWQEIELMRILTSEGHSGIAKIFDVSEDSANMTIVMEYIEGGDL